MIKTIIFIFLSLLVLNPIFSQNDGDRIFDNTVLHEIKIFSENDKLLNSLFDLWLNEIYNEGSKTYLKVNVVIDGDSLKDIGIRIKGGVTGFDKKKPLKLDFDKFNDKVEYDGIKKLNLHQGWMEKSYVREMLSLNILRTAGVKSSRTSPVKVYINDKYTGLCTLLEQVNPYFLRGNQNFNFIINISLNDHLINCL